MSEDTMLQEMYSMMDQIIDKIIDNFKKAKYFDESFSISERARIDLHNKISHLVTKGADLEDCKSMTVTYLRGYQIGLQSK